MISAASSQVQLVAFIEEAPSALRMLPGMMLVHGL
jgi:hypothetical protein